jgi:hypothetical protein
MPNDLRRPLPDSPAPASFGATAPPPLAWLPSPHTFPFAPCAPLVPFRPLGPNLAPSEDLFRAVLPLLARLRHRLGPSRVRLPVWGIYLFHRALPKVFFHFRALHLSRVPNQINHSHGCASFERRPVACVRARALVRRRHQMLQPAGMFLRCMVSHSHIHGFFLLIRTRRLVRVNNVWQRKTWEVRRECCWLGGDSTSYSKSQSCSAMAGLQFSVGLVCPSPEERQLCSNVLHLVTTIILSFGFKLLISCSLC